MIWRDLSRLLLKKKDMFLNRTQVFIPKHLELLFAKEWRRAMSFQWIYLGPMLGNAQL